jgi:uncharacterized membrane protein YecN with MAPEG domain
MPVPVTLLYGALCGFLLIGLAMNVSLVRGRFKAPVGQIPEGVVRPVRAHGNAAENIPMAILLLAILELSGINSLILHVFGGAFLLARILHAVGLITGVRISGLGITINHAVILAMCTTALLRHFAQ